MPVSSMCSEPLCWGHGIEGVGDLIPNVLSTLSASLSRKCRGAWANTCQDYHEISWNINILTMQRSSKWTVPESMQFLSLLFSEWRVCLHCTSSCALEMQSLPGWPASFQPSLSFWLSLRLQQLESMLIQSLLWFEEEVTCWKLQVAATPVCSLL